MYEKCCVSRNHEVNISVTFFSHCVIRQMADRHIVSHGRMNGQTSDKTTDSRKMP